MDAWNLLGNLYTRFTVEGGAKNVGTSGEISGRFLAYVYQRIGEEGRQASGLVPSPSEHGGEDGE